MATSRQAPIVLRAQRACLAAAAVGMLLTAGCNHRRSVLRPVMAAPRAVVAPSPCTSCNGAGGGCSSCGGTGSTVVEPGSTVIQGSSTRSGEPVISTPSGALDSSVDPSPPSPASTSRRTPSTSSERQPTAAPEPLLDDIPAATSSSRSRSLRPPIDSKAKSSVPDLAAPASSPTSMGSGGNSLRTTSTAGVVRRTSTSDALAGYFVNDEVNDLYFPNKVDRPWKYVVVHHSATETGSYSDIDAEHRKLLGLDGCGYHFVIGNGTGSGDGQIEVSQRWINQKHGVHCRNAKRADMDEYGIGICLIGDFEKAPPTPRQTAALKSLVAYLSERYKIDQDRLETHSHMAATPTVCPGKHFPTDALVVAPRPAAAQADARPTPTAATRRAVPTAWRLQDSEVEVPRLVPPAR
ncbi:peptidoglycan recognition protein family protein [Paludisphaera rhizosphaerae]|uniref:peptidoglycan recognition protein family protein n=1 Tax=Paludisphaera rhizosphaerae TaxID=2711216 RepID=UPI0013E9D1FB|nr:peptidoglycan recognition family protein [Paludisphaera rhizosphaerae]